MPDTEQQVPRAFRFIVAHPRAVLGAFLALSAVLGWQARQFELDASAETLLSEDNRQYVRTRVADQRFSPQEFVLVAYKPRRWPVLSAQTFEDLRALTAKLSGMQRVESVRTILNVPLLAPTAGGLSGHADLSAQTIERGGYTMPELRAVFHGHPLYEDLLINADQTATALQVLFRANPVLDGLQGAITDLRRRALDGELSAAEAGELERLRAQARPLERELEATRAKEVETLRAIVAAYGDDAEIHLGGLSVLAAELIRIIRTDLLVFGAAIAAMICLMLWLLFRRLRWVMLPAVCCACSVLATMGLLGLFGLKATVISSNFIALQLILTLAIVIHLIVQYREYLAEQPDWTQTQLVERTLAQKLGPCFYAGITTSVGFASLVLSDIRPVMAFGWMMMIAMAVSIGASLILFPAVVVLTGRDTVPVRTRPAALILNAFRDLALRHGTPIAAASVIILGISVMGMLRLDVENSFVNYFRQSTQVHQELAFIDRELGGSTPLDVIYTIPPEQRNPDLVVTARTVQTLQGVDQALQRHPAMGKVLSIVDFTEIARTLNDDRPLTEYELTALYWTLDDALRADLLNSFVSPQHAQLRISTRIRDTTEGLDRGKLLASLRQDLAGLGIPESSYELTGLFVLYEDLLQRLFRSQILTLGAVYAAMALMFWAIFRSLTLAWIALAPNVLATLAVLGVMGILRIPLDFMTITIAAIAMGISVDGAIHYVHRYLKELSHGSPDRAVARTHASVGHAMLYTSLILTLGFALLAFSSFVPSVLFGLLTGLAMVLALLSALTLLPVLLRRYVRTAAQ